MFLQLFPSSTSLHSRFSTWLCSKGKICRQGEQLAINHASVQGAIQAAISAVIDLLESSIFEI